MSCCQNTQDRAPHSCRHIILRTIRVFSDLSHVENGSAEQDRLLRGVAKNFFREGRATGIKTRPALGPKAYIYACTRAVDEHTKEGVCDMSIRKPKKSLSYPETCFGCDRECRFFASGPLGPSMKVFRDRTASTLTSDKGSMQQVCFRRMSFARRSKINASKQRTCNLKLCAESVQQRLDKHFSVRISSSRHLHGSSRMKWSPLLGSRRPHGLREQFLGVRREQSE